MSRIRTDPRVHADRAAGRHRDHRGLDRPALARRAGGARGGPAHPVRQQPEADRPGPAQLHDGDRRAAAGAVQQPHRRPGQLLGRVFAAPAAARPDQRSSTRSTSTCRRTATTHVGANAHRVPDVHQLADLPHRLGAGADHGQRRAVRHAQLQPQRRLGLSGGAVPRGAADGHAQRAVLRELPDRPGELHRRDVEHGRRHRDGPLDSRPRRTPPTRWASSSSPGTTRRPARRSTRTPTMRRSA